MMFTNIFQMRNSPEKGAKVRRVSMKGLPVDERKDRISFLQSIISNLNKNGIDCTLAPRDTEADITLIDPDRSYLTAVSSIYNSFKPEFHSETDATLYELKEAWKHRVRTHLAENGFQKVGRKYVKVDDLLNEDTDFKEAYEIQAEYINGKATVAVDPCTRIMETLTEKEIEEADRTDSQVNVQILPSWRGGRLTGRAGVTASEKSFELNGKTYPTPKYWKKKHDIGFVDPDEEMVNIYVPSFDKELPYPRSCVFSSYSRGRSLPDELKKDPKTRVSEAANMVESCFGSMKFGGEEADFSKLTTTSELGFKTEKFRNAYEFDVRLGDGFKTSVTDLHTALKNHGPYADQVNGKYVVITPQNGPEIDRGFKELESIYSQLNLGSIERCTEVGDNGIIDVGSQNSNAYANRITEIRSELDQVDSDLLAFVVLPGQQSDVYFQARGKLFERLFGSSPVPAQGIEYKNVVKLANDNGYFIGVNTSSQVYVKLGNVGSAVWILDEPADAHIPGVTPGSTCYAYHDVSRRPDKKSAATAYSATTDSYGRYIATGSQPSGGERLKESVFHDILNELLRKVSAFHRRQESSGEKPFHFERLVFAKDGKISWKEQRMMKEVIREGVPSENKRPIKQILEEDSLLPDDMIIDVISVNKSPNKRLISRDGTRFTNASGGSAVMYGDDSGLLVSHKPDRGTAQPLEITAKDHVSLNREDIPQPSAEHLLKEYYALSHLNWSSVFKQGKYALPQILTQNLGENLSAGIDIPENMAMI
ncbi:argonaute/piwi family protein [Halopiger aswanensis]|uniref:Piwi domain-containing protein n=1 Tax=Halopiger aswanensis TaxID=148449 RepID=A0A3R7KLK4_9EURY|nr:hypothetical protein [Halopiger aswanensis]RKD95645.1 hypothetical protein ATJ93_2506 [Halopiger aswanensis]